MAQYVPNIHHQGEVTESKETNLEKAKRLYPKGTKCTFFNGDDYIGISTGRFADCSESNQVDIYVTDKTYKNTKKWEGIHTFTLCGSNGKWGEIIEPSNEIVNNYEIY